MSVLVLLFFRLKPLLWVPNHNRGGTQCMCATLPLRDAFLRTQLLVQHGCVVVSYNAAFGAGLHVKHASKQTFSRNLQAMSCAARLSEISLACAAVKCLLHHKQPSYQPHIPRFAQSATSLTMHVCHPATERCVFEDAAISTTWLCSCVIQCSFWRWSACQACFKTNIQQESAGNVLCGTFERDPIGMRSRQVFVASQTAYSSTTHPKVWPICHQPPDTTSCNPPGVANKSELVGV